MRLLLLSVTTFLTRSQSADEVATELDGSNDYVRRAVNVCLNEKLIASR